jgi:regulator of protease activity HflC (stomatin/prohibitin superfamily)
MIPFNIPVGLIFTLFFIVLIITNIFKILREYERAVIFRLGRLIPVKGPGIIILIPLVDKMVRVDLRTVTFDVPAQDIITKDNISVKVNAVVYFRVIDPTKAITAVEDFHSWPKLAR